MQVEPPTDADARKRPAGQIDRRPPVVCIFERSCYSEVSFASGAGFQTRTSESHQTYEFHSGTIAGIPALLFVLELRSDVIRPALLALRQAASQGISVLVLGGIALPLGAGLEEGRLVVISDHINLLGDHPLVGGTVVVSGTEFPDMSDAYDKRLLERVETEAAALGQPAGRGVYLACREDMGATDPFVRAAVDAGARVRGPGIAPFAVLGAALRVPVVAAVLVNGSARHRPTVGRILEERKPVLAQALVRGVLSAGVENWGAGSSKASHAPCEGHEPDVTKSRARVALRVS